MERAQVLIRNISYNFLSYFWFAILALIFTPYIVKNLGTDAYGILAIVSVIVGYFALLDLGFGGATLKYVSEYYAKKEYDEVGRIIGTSLVVYPAAGFPSIAKQNGARLVIINREPTGLDDEADLVLNSEIGPTLGAALNLPG